MGWISRACRQPDREIDSEVISPRGEPMPIKFPGLNTIPKLFMGILYVVIFEGAFRKWVSQDLTYSLVMIRDVLAVCIIALAIKKQTLTLRRPGVIILFSWCALVFAFGIVQEIFNNKGVLVYMLGVRFWLLYLLAAYATYVSITEAEFIRVIKHLQINFFLMTPLVVVQHFSPVTSFINKQLEDDGFIFQVVEGVVRTTGTFSFTAGYTGYLLLVTPFMLILATENLNFWRRKWVPYVGLAALGVATLVSGSRGAIASFGIDFSVFVIATLFFSRGKGDFSRVRLLICTFVVGCLVAYLLTGAIDATEERFEGASEVESFSGRSAEMIIGNDALYREFSFLGDGIGIGVNFAGALIGSTRSFLAGEYETERTVRAGGLVGLIFIVLKLIVVIWGSIEAVKVLIRFGNPLPILLWIATAIACVTWSTLGQLSINALGFLLFGLALMSLRFPKISI